MWVCDYFFLSFYFFRSFILCENQCLASGQFRTTFLVEGIFLNHPLLISTSGRYIFEFLHIAYSDLRISGDSVFAKSSHPKINLFTNSELTHSPYLQVIHSWHPRTAKVMIYSIHKPKRRKFISSSHIKHAHSNYKHIQKYLIHIIHQLPHRHPKGHLKFYALHTLNDCLETSYSQIQPLQIGKVNHRNLSWIKTKRKEWKRWSHFLTFPKIRLLTHYLGDDCIALNTQWVWPDPAFKPFRTGSQS